MESLNAYIPRDRRQALLRGENLPDRAVGAVLFVDISGFTPLTEALVQQFGPRRGADELIRQLNLVYDLMIAEVHRWGGSVVSFSGDAITCWFDRDEGLNALASARAIRQAIDQAMQAEGPLARLSTAFAVKSAVTTGPVRRFLVGDPDIRCLEVLAGATVERIAEAESLAHQKEIVIDAETAAHLGDQVTIAEWRENSTPGRRYAVVEQLPAKDTPAPANLPLITQPPEDAPAGRLTDEQVRPWLLRPVYERLKAGRERFIAELRVAVALFLRFRGLDYDRDDTAGAKLDAYIRWVQHVLAGYEGYLIELSIGDKGSYLYAAFAAPLAHGYDAARAVTAALDLQTPPPELDFITDVQIGLSQGRMRAGPYGGSTRRTYGVQGSEVNVAARLMQHARPGQPLISKHVSEAASRNYTFKYLGAVNIKGRQDPIPVFGALNKRVLTPPRLISTVRREEALPQFEQILETVVAGQGQILRLEQVDKFGPSHLSADFIERALARGFQVTVGSCQPSRHSPVYAPWRQIFRAWFDLMPNPIAGQDKTVWTTQQTARLQTAIKEMNADWLPLLPLFGSLLDLSIPDNETTAGFDPFLRQGVLIALVIELVQTWTHDQPSLLLIEDAHWLDEPSQELILALARAMTRTPLALILVHGPIHSEDRPLLPELDHLAHYNQISLFGRSEPAARALQPPDMSEAASPPAPAAHPAGRLNGNTALGRATGYPRSRSNIIGRIAERRLLADRLQALRQDQTGGIVVIEGEAGIGKSRLVSDLLEQAQGLAIGGLIGAGDAIEKSTPYHVWRSVFSQLFNLETRPGADVMAQRMHVLSLLPTKPELLQLVPLLNVVLPLRLQENKVTRSMTGQVRADNTHKLLTHLLQTAVAQTPFILILEDAHWLDSASWTLARLVSQQVDPILLIIVTRPLVEPSQPEYRQLTQGPGVDRLQLEALPPDEAIRVACQRLGVSSLPTPIAMLIRQKAEGHPFFSEELAYALRDAGIIQVVNGECHIASNVENLSSINLPDTIEDVITIRVDRLTAAQQLTLKVASVVGHLFLFNLLRDIYPIENDKPHLTAYLNSLEGLNITLMESPEPELAYIFKHTLIRDVVYNLLLFTQRWELHQAVAEWIEATYTNDLSPFYPLLAYHWSQVVQSQQAEPGLVAKALDYLERAGKKALRDHANQEAVQFFNDALTLAKKIPKPPPITQFSLVEASPTTRTLSPLRLARWERQLGQAHLGLGNLAQGRKHLSQALGFLELPVPGQTLSFAVHLIRQALRQVWHRLRPPRTDRQSSEEKERLLEGARATERLGEINYWSNETTSAIYAVLRTLNLAERAGPSPELARAYANMCLVAGFISWHSLAQAYARRAQEVAQSVEHRAALAWVLEIIAIYSIGVGNWPYAIELLVEGARLSDQLKDQRRWAECLRTRGDTLNFQGKFTESAELWPAIYTSAHRRGDAQAQSWGLAGRLRTLLPQGQHNTETAIAAVSRLEMLLSENIGPTDEANSYGILALVYLRRGQLHLAHQAGDAAARLITQSSPTGFGTIHGYVSVPEVYLTLWEMQVNPAFDAPPNSFQPNIPVQILKHKALQACQALHKYARTFPIGRPRAWLWQGLHDWLAGRPNKAHAAWHKSLDTARQLGMLYEQGLAHYQIGRHLPLDDPHGQQHLTQAAQIFTQIKATYDLARTERVLAVSGPVGQ